MTDIPEFYVLNPNRKDVKELLKRMVANGIPKFDGLERNKEQTGWGKRYDPDKYGCWGRSNEYGTYTNNTYSAWALRSKQLTMDEVRVLLPLPIDNKDKQK